MKKEVFKLQAEICKTLANPKRLEIIDALRDDELSVTEIVERLSAATANVSQHLAVLRKSLVVSARREGASIYYRINNPRILEACSLMKAVLLDQLEESEKLARSMKKEKRHERRRL